MGKISRFTVDRIQILLVGCNPRNSYWVKTVYIGRLRFPENSDRTRTIGPGKHAAGVR